MKRKSIHILYRLTAFLADKTKGVSIFAGWKIALGTLLIGTTVASCSSHRIPPGATCYIKGPPHLEKEKKEPTGDASSKTNEKDRDQMIRCYAVGPPRFEKEKAPSIDSTLTNLSLDIKEGNR